MPFIIGHRGARAEAPENTVASFVYAFNAGITDFELDVRLSRDNELMVIHDRTVNRTTNGRGKVSELNAAEMALLNAASHIPPWSEACPVPRLEEVLESCPDFTSIQFEVKSDKQTRIDQLVGKLATLLRQSNYLDRSVVTSADTYVLKKMKELAPEVSRGYVAERSFPGPIATARKYDCQLLALSYRLASARYVRECKESGLEVSVWTVNSTHDIQRMVANGVDSIITDYPSLAINLIGGARETESSTGLLTGGSKDPV